MANNEKDDIYTLTDEEGNESEFEYLGELSIDDNNYLALIPLDGEDDEYVILKVTADENGEEMLVTIDDDDEFDRVADAFEDTFMDECDLDENYVDGDEEDEDEDDGESE
ncbi:MAG: DUF1292 domain-containing protein [Clostridia bacterium]|nr:DUF1292 domain-containing protein [Clostridia bacterium]MBR4799551.1 DUF1292 domain-containing protein [Clostridia bacterium]MBR5746086.1 DUF1292 domain-containing protein [Clostridia bacterium]